MIRTLQPDCGHWPSRPASETHFLGIMTYKNGRWGSPSGVGVMMHYDYASDLADENAQH